MRFPVWKIITYASSFNYHYVVVVSRVLLLISFLFCSRILFFRFFFSRGNTTFSAACWDRNVSETAEAFRVRRPGLYGVFSAGLSRYRAACRGWDPCRRWFGHELWRLTCGFEAELTMRVSGDCFVSYMTQKFAVVSKATRLVSATCILIFFYYWIVLHWLAVYWIS